MIEKNSNNWSIYVCMFFAVLCLILVIVFCLSGDIKTSGSSSTVSSESLSCSGDNIQYPFFGTDKVQSNNDLVINAVFNDNTLLSINLVIKTIYDNSDTARVWSNAHEFLVVEALEKDGLGAYGLNANFYQNDNIARMSLYAAGNEIDSKTIKYFMLNTIPKTMDEYKKNYLDFGFVCDIK